MVNRQEHTNIAYVDFLNEVGIHPAIVQTLTQRRIPVNNLYWEHQESYIDRKVRFLSIPFWLQICFQNGISLTDLLSERTLQVMEQMLHFAEQEERQQLSWEECAEECQSIDATKTIADTYRARMPELLLLAAEYPAYKALRRGNFLIFHSLLLCSSFDEALYLSRALIDMISCGCIIDDLYDVKEDRMTGEANIMIELGDDLSAVNHIRTLFFEKMQALQKHLPKTKAYLEKAFNQVMANYLFHQ